MNIAQAKCIPIPQYLESQGLRPKHTRQNGRELWYHSPIREGDKTPSFKVDAVKNLWYDHGSAEGGTIIDLVRALCACDVREALRHLDRTGLYSPMLSRPATSATRGSRAQVSISAAARDSTTRIPDTPRIADEKEKGGGAAFEVVAHRPLTHPALMQYLQAREIDPEVAREYLSEIDFKAPGSPGNYFALGYPAGDGFEARNALFKGFVGSRKTVSYHDKPEARLLQVFEGFMDFLSYLSKDRPSQPVGSVLVLNSTNLWQRALPFLNDPRFEEIRLYLDNDTAGDAATRKFFDTVQSSAKLVDMRSYYAGYEDLNAWLMGTKT